MSQKVHVTGFKLTGHAYTGIDDNGTPQFLHRGQDVAHWLAYNWRVRFNQQRSLRKKYVYQDGERLTDEVGTPLLAPIGRTVTDITHAQAKATLPWMSAMPSMVMHHALRAENESWFAAAKRRKTNKSNGTPGGRMPGFKSKNSSLTFGCYTNNGQQQVLRYTKTGRRSAMITLRGFNPAHAVTPERPRVWELRIRVRMSAHRQIAAFTSILVNLNTMTLVLVGAPPARTHTPTGKSVGIDRGAKITLATSDGHLLNPSRKQAATLNALERAYKANQRRMARSQVIALGEGRDFRTSNRYQALKAEGRALAARANRIRTNWRHQTTTQLVNAYDYIAVEDLKIKAMTRSASGTLSKPGKNVAQKRGLNRVMSDASPSMLLNMLTYKAVSAGVPVIAVNPKWTSQRCNACGHIQPENRENQGFSCRECGHTDHADINAARNILDRAVGIWDGTRSNRVRAQKASSRMRELAVPA